jgi:hypothetical protein
MTVGVLVILILVAYGIEDWRGHHAWQKYVSEAKARGESFDPASVIPPPVRDSENLGAAPLFAPLFNYTWSGRIDEEPKWNDPAAKAALDQINLADAPPTNAGSEVKQLHEFFSALEDLNSGHEKRPPSFVTWQNGRLEDLIGWQDYYRSRANFPKNPDSGTPGAAVLVALSRFDGPYQELRAACARPRSRFPIHYDEQRRQHPHYPRILSFASIAGLRACAELSLGQANPAFDDTLVSLRLFDSIENEPAVISLLVRFSLADTSIQPIWEGLALHQWSEEQLAMFESRLERTNFPANCQLAMRGERVLASFKTIDWARKDPDGVASMISEVLDESSRRWGYKILKTALSIVPSGWYDQNKVVLSEGFDRLINCADPLRRRILLERVGQFQSELKSYSVSILSPYSILENLTQPSLIHIPVTSATAQTEINLTRVAIALERHWLRHGEYPESLAKLDSACQPNGIPSDVVTGNPPRYSLNSDGTFQLEYEGWKTSDAGPDAAWKNLAREHLQRMKNKWSWPQPKQGKN